MSDDNISKCEYGHPGCVGAHPEADPDAPMQMFWLSFCDGDRPAGTQFLGAAVVPGRDIGEAITNAHRLHINPGGEVLGKLIDPERASLIDQAWLNRLLNREQCEVFDDEWGMSKGGRI